MLSDRTFHRRNVLFTNLCVYTANIQLLNGVWKKDTNGEKKFQNIEKNNRH